jgi:hypothetical protein
MIKKKYILIYTLCTAKKLEEKVRQMPNAALPIQEETPIETTSSRWIREYSYCFDQEQCNLDENLDLGHRHFSLLHWVYPGHFLPYALTSNPPSSSQSSCVTHTPELIFQKKQMIMEAAKGSLLRKRYNNGGHTSWSAAWEATLWARVYDGEEAYKSLSHFMSRYVANNLLSLHPILDTIGSDQCHTCFTDTHTLQEPSSHQQEPSLPKELIRNRRKPFHPPQKIIIEQAAPPDAPEDGTIVQQLVNMINSQQQNTNSQQIGRGILPERNRGMIRDDGSKFQLDGNLGYMTAVTEMLIQSYRPGHIDLLSALPEAWEEAGHLLGVRIRGNSRVSLSWQEHKIQVVMIELTRMKSSQAFHPWWTHLIEESCDYPGFYTIPFIENQTDKRQNLQSISLTVTAPNSLVALKYENMEKWNIKDINLCPISKVLKSEEYQNGISTKRRQQTRLEISSDKKMATKNCFIVLLDSTVFSFKNRDDSTIVTLENTLKHHLKFPMK